MSGIAACLGAWSASYKSTESRIDVRNIRQGGNIILTTIPLGTQAMWASSVLAKVAAVTVGPLRYIAMFFQAIFFPLISYPLAIISSAVKTRFYESSVTAKLDQQIKYYEKGEKVDNPIKGTVTLKVDGKERHFHLGEDVTWDIERSIRMTVDGKCSRFRYYTNKEDVDEKNRLKVDLDGKDVFIDKTYPLSESYQNVVEHIVDGKSRFFKIICEAITPVVGTVTLNEKQDYTTSWGVTLERNIESYYLIGKEIGEKTDDCITIGTDEGTLHYETGIEVDASFKDARSFTIDGKLRYFSSAKLVPDTIWGLSGVWNRIRYLPKIPTRLSKIGSRFYEFASDHMSAIIRISLIVSGVALAVFSSYAVGASVLAAVVYEYLDHDLGIIPKKVSLFMEKWMPAISLVGLLIVGSIPMKVLSGVSLLMMNSKINIWVQQKMSHLFRIIMLNGFVNELLYRTGNLFIRGPSNTEDRARFKTDFEEVLERTAPLDQYDASIQKKTSLTKDEIEKIFAVEDQNFEFHPAHFTKEIELVKSLEKNNNYSSLIDLWEKNKALLLKDADKLKILEKLAFDDKFIDFLKLRFPEAKQFHYENLEALTFEQNNRAYLETRGQHLEQIKEWVNVLAKEKNFNESQFIIDWIGSQLRCFVDKLSGKKAIEGRQTLLVDTAENVEAIIPFLLDPETSRVDVEDALLKLAIEGGDYCSLGMKRASQEVLDGFIEPLINPESEREKDLSAFIERKVYFTLKKIRFRALQMTYNSAVRYLRERQSLNETADDVHLYDTFMGIFKRRFFPMKEDEMQSAGVLSSFFGEILYKFAQTGVNYEYRRLIQNEMASFGNDVIDYLRIWTEKNLALKKEEKEELLGGILSKEREHLSNSDGYGKRWVLLAYVLGVTRKKSENPIISEKLKDELVKREEESWANFLKRGSSSYTLNH